MDDWKTWYDRARVAKEQSGKSDADLSAAINDQCDRKAGRAQVNHFFTGKRDPTLSQFMVLCTEVGADPGQILFGVPVLPTKEPKVAKVLQSKPQDSPRYGIQEKRLKMRRTAKPGRKRVTA